MAIASENETRAVVDVSSMLAIDEPKRYYVVMHNDDTTPIDFVIDVLIKLYRHDEQTAADLANKIHVDEKAIVGMYNMEIAEQKIEETVTLCRTNGYSLSVTMEPAD
ncbi:ATP-dependent Clp protease adaptor ClpS [bacterium]|nr:ATP-dependent Clp protease adaptor ClpS [bacterium]